MKKFIIAVNAGINFHYAFIKVDNYQNEDPAFYLDLMKSAFPNREHVSRMLGEYRKAAPKTLFSCDDLQSLIDKRNANEDVLCVLAFDSSNEWRLID